MHKFFSLSISDWEVQAISNEHSDVVCSDCLCTSTVLAWAEPQPSLACYNLFSPRHHSWNLQVLGASSLPGTSCLCQGREKPMMNFWWRKETWMMDPHRGQNQSKDPYLTFLASHSWNQMVFLFLLKEVARFGENLTGFMTDLKTQNKKKKNFGKNQKCQRGKWMPTF